MSQQIIPLDRSCFLCLVAMNLPQLRHAALHCVPSCDAMKISQPQGRRMRHAACGMSQPLCSDVRCGMPHAIFSSQRCRSCDIATALCLCLRCGSMSHAACRSHCAVALSTVNFCIIPPPTQIIPPFGPFFRKIKAPNNSPLKKSIKP